METLDRQERVTSTHPSFAEAFRFWLKLGFISFGGPTGQIAIMQAELVEKKRWISQARFLSFLQCSFCGGCFLYAGYGNVPWIAAVFYGLKPAVLAIVAFAVIRIGKKALRNSVMWGIAAAAFVAIFFLKVPFPVIILTAAITGYFGGKLAPTIFSAAVAHGSGENDHYASVLDDDAEIPEHARRSKSRALRIIAVCGLLWWLSILALGLSLGWNHTLFQQGVFFSKAAVVTFGGAYAVLPYVGQQASEHYHWLAAGQMMDGLGLAETTPGPLIMVLQFVGFMGGWNQPMGLSPLIAATLGALITTWATFVPCFLWIFLGAPYIEHLRGNTTIASTLTTVTAAVVGVVLNLAVWFGIHVLFAKGNAIDWFALGLALVALVGMVKWRWDVIPVILGCGFLGLLMRTFTQ